MLLTIVDTFRTIFVEVYYVVASLASLSALRFRTIFVKVYPLEIKASSS